MSVTLWLKTFSNTFWDSKSSPSNFNSSEYLWHLYISISDSLFNRVCHSLFTIVCFLIVCLLSYCFCSFHQKYLTKIHRIIIERTSHEVKVLTSLKWLQPLQTTYLPRNTNIEWISFIFLQIFFRNKFFTKKLPKICSQTHTQKQNAPKQSN